MKLLDDGQLDEAHQLLMQIVMNGDRLENFEQLIHEWAKARGLFENPSPRVQADKTLEETNELIDGVNADDVELIADAIGDIVVTLVIQAHMHELSLGECMWKAWNQIKDRTGKTVDGLFIKDE